MVLRAGTDRGRAVTLRVAVLTMALLGSAACGSAEQSGDTEQTPAAALSEPSQPSASSAGGPVVEDPEGRTVPVGSFVDTVSRSLDRATTAQLTLDVVSTAVTVSGRGEVDYTGERPAVRLWLRVPSLGEGTIEARLVDEVLYVAMPMVQADGTFFRVDLADPGNPLGGGPGELGALDPRAAMRAFGSAVQEVRMVGRESLGGVDTRHFWVRADGTALRDVLGTDGAGNGAGDEAGAAAGVPAEFAFDVWLDGRDRVRQVVADLGATGSLEISLSGWGAPVTITAPPASRVEEMPRG